MRRGFATVSLVVAAMAFGCRSGAPVKPAPVVLRDPVSANPDGTREMAVLLKTIADGIQPDEIEFLLNEKKADAYRSALASATSLPEKTKLRLNLAIQLLNAGHSEEAAAELDRLEADTAAADPALWAQGRYLVRGFQALAALRVAEEQNCCARNTPDSCLFPVRGRGIHTRPDGSRRAMKILLEMLEEQPGDLRARWLLNIAAMTLGRYPAGVPEAYRISPVRFRAEYPLPKFTNVAPLLGMDLLGRSGGCVVDDLDGDGLFDILISGIGFEDPLRFFHNNGDGTFPEKTRDLGLDGITGGLNMVHADYDNDGDNDVVVLRGGWMGRAGRFPFSLLQNQGKARFRDVTKAAGLLRFGPTQTATWLDYDLDGWLDLFVGFESSELAGQHPCALFRNNRDGTFVDVAEKAWTDVTAFIKAAVSGDYNNDGRPDLLLTVGGKTGGLPILLQNTEKGVFVTAGPTAGIQAPDQSFGAFFFDYDNDGWQDIFIMGYGARGVEDIAAAYLGLPSKAKRMVLYRNQGDGTYANVSEAANLDRVVMGMALNFGDLDNDGWLDFHTGTGTPELSMVIPNRTFRNDGGKRFQDVTTAGNFGNLQKGHAIAFADLNGDGHQDIFEQMGGANFGDVAFSSLFANPGNGNRWIALELAGVKSNRSAIGAKIAATVRTPRGSRMLHRVVSSGGSFGASPLRQHFGVGDATAVEEIAIRWPSGALTRLKGLETNRAYRIQEGSESAEPILLPKFAWPKDAP